MCTRKILCLHGFPQNKSVFAAKSSGLRKALKKKGFETKYISGPIRLQLEDLPFEPSDVKSKLGADQSENDDEGYRTWYQINAADPATYFNIDESLKLIEREVKENGPYDGIMGFSMGAGFAALLTQYFRQVPHKEQPPFRFAIFYCGFIKGFPQELVDKYFSDKITTPSIHIIGSLDTVLPEDRTSSLVEGCTEDSRTVLVHPGGHYVPNSKDLVNKVVNWVLAQYADKEEDKAADEKKPAEEKKDEDEWAVIDNLGKA